MPVVFCEIDSPRAAIADGETHVYIAPLGEPGALATLLTDDEQFRANRFRLTRVRNQFVAARGQLRELLGCYLGISPKAVPMLYADGGKPHLPPEYPLEFNLSHTDGLAVFAFGTTRVGVDVERERAIPDAEGLVSRFFARREIAEFMAVPPPRRQAAFLKAWTRKEAVLKAIGRGVQSLDYCEVTIAEDEPPAVRSIEGDASAGDRWQLFTWEPEVGYLAAVAVEK